VEGFALYPIFYTACELCSLSVACLELTVTTACQHANKYQTVCYICVFLLSPKFGCVCTLSHTAVSEVSLKLTIRVLVVIVLMFCLQVMF